MTEPQEQDVLVLGQPEDRTGLRQFLVDSRPCEFGGMPLKRPVLIWVAQGVTVYACGHAGYVIARVSVIASKRHGMIPYPDGRKGPAVVCGKRGRFVE
jgi:hypothetical protein